MAVAIVLLPLTGQADQAQTPAASTPQIRPWHKPVYPQSRAVFVEGFKQAGYALVCGVKEMRDCLGFTSNCLVEVSAHTDKCVAENSAHLPLSFASAEQEKPVNQALFACMAEKQRLSGQGQISVAACNKVNEMHNRAAAQQKSKDNQLATPPGTDRHP